MECTAQDACSLDPFQNPYHPFEEPECYHAFQKGWTARRQKETRTSNPYALSELGPALAWLDGWTVADWSTCTTEKQPTSDWRRDHLPRVS